MNTSEELKEYIFTCGTCGKKSGDIRNDLHAFDGWAGNGIEHRCPDCVEKQIQKNEQDKTNMEMTLRAKYGMPVRL